MKRIAMKMIALVSVLGLVMSLACTALAKEKDANENRSTSIHVHVSGDFNKVTSVAVVLNGNSISLSRNGQSGNWTVSDKGGYVSNGITSVMINGTAVSFTKGVEANGTINISVTYTAPKPTTAIAHVYVCLSNEIQSSGPQRKDKFSASIGTVTVNLTYNDNGSVNTNETNTFDGYTSIEVSARIAGPLPTYNGQNVIPYTVKYDRSDGWHVDCILATATIVDPTPAETPEQPAETPEQPAETPAQPTETPEQPAETPAQPTETPEQPAETPAQPAETPAQPTETPEQPAETPEQPAETPAQPTETPAQPTETPEQPAETPAQPAETPAQPTETPEQPAETPAQPTVDRTNDAQVTNESDSTIPLSAPQTETIPLSAPATGDATSIGMILALAAAAIVLGGAAFKASRKAR